MSPSTPGLDAAFHKVAGAVQDPEIGARYPDQTHFVAADDPEHGGVATAALFAGSPVALVYPDGRELLLTPDEHTRGLIGLSLLATGLLYKLTSRRRHEDVIEFPPRTRVRVEARDRVGIREAA
jgi:hypothetical protein